jgi:hypothetical protein
MIRKATLLGVLCTASVGLCVSAAVAADWSPPTRLGEGIGLALAARPHGGALVARATGRPFRIRAVAVDSAGRRGRPVSLAGVRRFAGGLQVAVDAHGRAVALWEAIVPLPRGQRPLVLPRSRARARAVTAVTAAIRSSAGAWSRPAVLSPPGDSAHDAVLRVNARGDAIAAWRSRDHIEVAFRPSGGRFGRPVIVPRSTVPCCYALDAAIGPSGEALVVWRTPVVRAVWRSPRGALSPTRTLAAGSGYPPVTAIGPDGEAVVVFAALGANPGLAVVVKRAGARTFARPQVLPGAAGTARVNRAWSAAYDARGTLTLVWEESAAPSPGRGPFAVGRVATTERPRGGAFAAPTILGDADTDRITAVRLAIAPDGAGAVTWTSVQRMLAARGRPASAVTRGPGGAWSAASAIAPPGVRSLQLAIDDRGCAFAAWIRTQVLELSRACGGGLIRPHNRAG